MRLLHIYFTTAIWRSFKKIKEEKKIAEGNIKMEIVEKNNKDVSKNIYWITYAIQTEGQTNQAIYVIWKVTSQLKCSIILYSITSLVAELLYK